MKKIIASLFPLLLTSFLIAEMPQDSSAITIGTSTKDLDKDSLWKAKLRARALIKLDKMLNWAIPPKERAYALHLQKEGFHYINETPPLIEFSKSFGYFSKKHPIISTVTPYKEDIEFTSRLFKRVFLDCKNEDFLEMATGEIICKVLAYRQLEEGMVIAIPAVYEDGSKELVDYRVEKVFALWSGMPAFGLKPIKRRASPILLFRGTDLSLESKQGWASVLSDLDIQGPGLTVFQKSKRDLEDWLVSQKEGGVKAKVMGFSLGGVLALYTLVYESDLINSYGSMVFNPPGVSASVYKQWKEVSPRPQLKVYVTHGDFIPKIGKLAGDAYELSLDFSLKPMDAHVRLMCCQPHIYQFTIDEEKENSQRR